MASILLSGSVGSGGAFAILGVANVEIVGNADLVLSLGQYSNYFLQVTSDGASAGVRKVVPPIIEGETFIIQNKTSEGFAINVIGASGAGVLVPPGAMAVVVCDGTNYVQPTAAGAAPPWVAVAAGGSASPAAQVATQFYAVDSSGAQASILLPATPVDGQVVVIKLAAASVSSPVLIVAGAATTVENPANPGNFSTTAGTVALATQGALYGLKYQATNTRWIQER